MKIKFYILVSSGFIIAGCSGATSPDQIVFSADSVSYAKDIEPYFALACVSCHDDGSSIDLSSCIAIKSDPGVVVVKTLKPPVGDTTASGLVLVMYGKEAIHPQINANDNQRQGIKQWVLEGAQDN